MTISQSHLMRIVALARELQRLYEAERHDLADAIDALPMPDATREALHPFTLPPTAALHEIDLALALEEHTFEATRARNERERERKRKRATTAKPAPDRTSDREAPVEFDPAQAVRDLGSTE